MKKHKVLKGIIRYLLIIIFALILGINTYSTIAVKVNNEPLPMPFGIGMSVVLTGSMEPTISAGDIIIVRDTGDYQVGDIIVYKSGNSAVCHRIISKENGVVVTQGDANNGADSPISESVILGEVVLNIPYVGYVMSGLQSTAGIILTIFIVFLLLNAGIRADKKEKEEEKQKLLEELLKLNQEIEEMDNK